MRRWFTALAVVLVACSAILLDGLLGGVTRLPTATAADAPIGRLGDTLRIEDDGLIADVSVLSVEPSEIPPGFGYPPRPPRQQVWKAKIVIQAIRVPTPYAMAKSFIFNGVTPTGDAYQPRNSDAPEALQYGLLNAPDGATVAGFVYWDCYRDLVTNVVLTNKQTGVRLAQWNL